MPLVVEDGSGLSDAAAYISTSYADTYHAARGRTDWAGLSSDAKTQAVVRATDYIEWRFGSRFRGYKRSKTQALQWPRHDAADNNGWNLDGVNAVPPQLKKASAEYALIAARAGELAANPPPPNGTQSPATGTITGTGQASGTISRIRKSIAGAIDKDVSYATTRSQTTRIGASGGLVSPHNIPEYPLADSWLAELIKSSISSDIHRA